MKIKSIRGMEDMLPDKAAVWQEIEQKARDIFRVYGYSEIRTPALEETSLFVRSIGDATDIVQKEMYTFKDRKDRSLTLRPEGTAPIIRSYLEHNINIKSPFVKLYYIGPMFRSERPQKGRTRQFHQIGVEIIGSGSPYADLEMFIQIADLFKAIRLEKYVIKINSLGCRKDKEAFSADLKKYLIAKKARLCDDCKARIDRNPLRALDCKQESCVQAMKGAPKVPDHLCGPCRTHFDSLKRLLEEFGIDVEVAPNLVRGLDYYTSTVFEITHPALGGQDAIGAGGRYDNLVKDLGGPQTSAVGYALGIERMLIALGDSVAAAGQTGIFIATSGDAAREEGERLARALRKEFLEKNVFVLTDLKGSSLNAQMRSANKAGAKFVVIIGEDELKKGTAVLKDMDAHKQDDLKKDSVVKELVKRIPA